MLNEVVKKCNPLDKNSKLLIFGGGFSGQYIAEVARCLGAKVLCSRRSNNKPGADFIFDSSKNLSISEKIFEGTTHLLSCIPPDPDGSDPVLKHLKDQIINLKLNWTGYLSTTGVYGDSHGEWVDEHDIPKPKQQRSKNRLNCELAWRQEGIEAQILRLPGIYGTGRSAIETILRGKCRLIHKPGQVFSRIHVDDIAGSIMHLIELSNKGIKPDVINISDNFPCTNIEVLKFASQLINFSLPEVESFEIASKDMSPMALSFWQENRRVNNNLLCNNLSYKLIHPDYKSGLKDCLINMKK